MGLFSFFNRSSGRQSRPRPQRSPSLQLETLEDRCVPSATLAASAQGYTVTILSDAGQAAPINGGIPSPFQVLVEYNGHPVQGVPVSFDAPIWVTPPSMTISNPSGYFLGVPVMPFPPFNGPPFVSITGNATTDANGVATAPDFVANGIAGTYNVTAEAFPSGNLTVGPVSFTMVNAVFPGPLPSSINQQLFLNLAALPSFANPQSESELANQFGPWFALSYLQSPQQTTLLFWHEFSLVEDLVLAGGNYAQFQNNLGEWELSYQIGLNPVYNTLPGYGMALIESELLLANVVG